MKALLLKDGIEKRAHDLRVLHPQRRLVIVECASDGVKLRVKLFADPHRGLFGAIVHEVTAVAPPRGILCERAGLVLASERLWVCLCAFGLLPDRL